MCVCNTSMEETGNSEGLTVDEGLYCKQMCAVQPSLCMEKINF